MTSNPDARMGHKIADSAFFGYKTTHLAMTEYRIITAAVITTGEKNDGKQLQTLIEKSKAAGIQVNTVIGDTAYSEKDKEDEFLFNKDAGMYVCPAGHMAIRKDIRP